MTPELFLISDVAKRLNVRPHKISFLLMSRKIDEPKLRMGNRRIFTHEDATRVANALGLTWDSSGKNGE